MHVGKPRCRTLEVLKPSSIANSLFATTKPTVERINDWLQLKAPPEVFQLIPSKGAPGFSCNVSLKHPLPNKRLLLSSSLKLKLALGGYCHFCILPRSQRLPLNPSRQTHLKLPGVFTQVPLFLHGPFVHSSSSKHKCSQYSKLVYSADAWKN